MAVAPVPFGTHWPLNVPVLLVMRVKLAPGVALVPTSVSVMVTVHVDMPGKVTGVVHVIEVLVVRELTVMVNVLELML